MKESLRERIINQFQSRYRHGKQDYVNGGQIERFAEALGYKGSNASRRLREMFTEGLLEREERKLKDSHIKSVWYKYIPTERDKLVYLVNEKTPVSKDTPQQSGLTPTEKDKIPASVL